MKKLVLAVARIGLALSCLGQSSGRAAERLSSMDAYQLGLAEGKLTALCVMFKTKHLDRTWAQRYIKASLISFNNSLKFKSQSSANEAAAALRGKVLSKVPRCRQVWPVD